MVSIDSKRHLEEYFEEGGFTLGLAPYQAEQLAAITLTMPNYLFTYLGGKIEMASSLESRYPFLDQDLVRYVTTLPASILFANEQEKGILRIVADKWLPKRISNRLKHGFSAPILPKKLCQAVVGGKVEAMCDDKINSLGFFDARAIKSLYLSLVEPGLFGDVNRVLRERLAVFVLSVQLMQEMMIASAVPKPLDREYLSC